MNREVMPSGTNSQTTAYVYGTTSTSGVFSNDLLAKIEYPSASTGSASTASTDDQSYTYDNLGEKSGFTDQNGTIHAYGYDVLGRLVSDTASTVGSGVSSSTRRLGYSFNDAGLPFKQTSYYNTSGTNVENQVEDVYNGYGQLITQYQAVAGTVNTSTTPSVQYGFSQPTGTNYSRQSTLTYPNGRVVDYNYNSGIDGDISRLSSMSDSGGNIESYSYLGLSTIVREIRPGSVLTYVKANGASNGDAGDMYTGLDRFGRVVDQLWVTSDTVSGGTGGDILGTTTDQFEYGYDQNSNVLYKNNMVHSADSELYHANSSSSGDNATAYDPLNRLTAFRRGTLSSSGNNGTTLDTVTTASATNSWSLDALGNSTSTGGVSRTVNSKNQITAISGLTTPTYDHNGNVTTDQTGNQYSYDAWNRLVFVNLPGLSTNENYTYSAGGARPGISVCNGAVTTSYYSANWQDLEDDVVTSGPTTTKNTYLWSEAYIDELVARDTSVNGGGVTRTYAQQDANHDVTSLVNSSGTVLERFIYDPYGKQTVLNASWSSTSDSYNWVYGFQGGRLDPLTGLVNFRNRDLNPTTGTWMEQDPASYIDGSDLYQFVQSSPVTRVDPGGLKASSNSAPTGSVPFISIPSEPARNFNYSSADRTLILPGYGTVVVYAQNDTLMGAGSTPAGGFELKVTKANGCPCTRLEVSQQVKITVNGHLLPSELQKIIDSETNEHLGHNPFDGYVLDNGTMQFPPHPNDNWSPPPGTVYLNRYQPGLSGNDWKDRNSPFVPGDLVFGDFPFVNALYPKGTVVTKEYIDQLYCDGVPIGPKIHWTMQGTVGNGQTSAINIDLVP